MVEVIQGEVIENVATRDFVGEQTALVRQELAEQIASVRHELAEQIASVRQEIGAVRQELVEETGSLRTDIANTRAELLGAINRQTIWMNGFLVALLVAVLGLGGVLIGKL